MVLKTTRQRATNALDRILENISGSGTGGKIKLYTGAPPASLAAAPTGNLLATLTIRDGYSAYAGADSTPALGPVSTGIEGGGVFADTTAPSELIIAPGTPGWFRVFDYNTNAVFQGTVGVTGSGADMELTSTTFVVGGTVTLTGSTVQLLGVI